MAARMLYLHALSPIHSGTGQSTGVIDLPVARETVLNWPFLPASGLKGTLRAACDPGASAGGEERNTFRQAFGPDTQNASEFAGALWFCDAHLLCFPVRSYFGTFAWVTCPLALQRWRRDYLSSGLTAPPALAASPPEDAILVAPAHALTRQESGSGGRAARQVVYLEDLDLTAETSAEAAAIADYLAAAVFADADWQRRFRDRFAVVGDDLFTSLTQMATEVAARIKLKEDSKTVQGGALWYEEALPPETILSCPVLVDPARNEEQRVDAYFRLVVDHLATLLQIGGDASVGRGLVEMRLSEVPA